MLLKAINNPLFGLKWFHNVSVFFYLYTSSLIELKFISKFWKIYGMKFLLILKKRHSFINGQIKFLNVIKILKMTPIPTNYSYFLTNYLMKKVYQIWLNLNYSSQKIFLFKSTKNVDCFKFLIQLNNETIQRKNNIKEKYQWICLKSPIFFWN